MAQEKTPVEAKIRAYRKADYKACRALWIELMEYQQKLYNFPVPTEEYPGKGFDDYLKDPTRKGTWVAEAGDNIVGFISLLVSDDVRSEVEPFIVLERYRGQGIGHRLISRAIQEAKKLDSVLLTIRPGARNTESITKFMHFGFDRVGDIELIKVLKANRDIKTLPGIQINGIDLDM
jgi:GNAT superfamily N-acetyltransferase